MFIRFLRRERRSDAGRIARGPNSGKDPHRDIGRSADRREQPGTPAAAAKS